MTRVREVADRLAAIPLFSRCEPRDLRIVARHAEVITIPGSTDIVSQGHDGDALYILLDGRARVVRDGQPAGALAAGDYFGELALLDPAPRAATVTAEVDCELAVLGARMFKVLLRDIPPIAAQLLATLAADVRDAGRASSPEHTPRVTLG